jgi:Ca2+-binding EF-hand superfamily protein
MRVYLADKIAINTREIYEIFEKFDWSRQGFISKDDFLH